MTHVAQTWEVASLLSLETKQKPVYCTFSQLSSNLKAHGGRVDIVAEKSKERDWPSLLIERLPGSNLEIGMVVWSQPANPDPEPQAQCQQLLPPSRAHCWLESTKVGTESWVGTGRMAKGTQEQRSCERKL